MAPEAEAVLLGGVSAWGGGLLQAEATSEDFLGNSNVPETDPASKPYRPGSTCGWLPDTQNHFPSLGLNFPVCKIGQQLHRLPPSRL